MEMVMITRNVLEKKQGHIQCRGRTRESSSSSSSSSKKKAKNETSHTVLLGRSGDLDGDGFMSVEGGLDLLKRHTGWTGTVIQ